MIEPIHDLTAMDTGMSKMQGRLKKDIGGKKLKKRKVIKKIIKKYGK